MQNDTCYILALFKRDDGERLLLGSGYYAFANTQKHFNPNTFSNDVVELQGTDGQLLAGQVRRSTSQSFDGFVGNGTTSRSMVEQKRREFFLFFRKQHHYTVVYIMPDGTTIKRERGYITDAPAVQELYQVQPKYHVALAFEDVNYYSYAEDAQGNEIYSFSATLALANIEDGGLVWDENGAISDNTGLEDIQLLGNTIQQGIPTPTSPVAIQTATGMQTITINGSNYPLDLGDIELCKLDTYQDYIWKDGDDWKICKNTNRFTFETPKTSGLTKQPLGFVYNIDNNPLAGKYIPLVGKCSHFKIEPTTATWTELNKVGMNAVGALWFRTAASAQGDTRTIEEFAQWLADSRVSFVYALATPTDTVITDTTLIDQLEAIAEAMSVNGKPTTITATDQNLPAIITGKPNGTGGYVFAPSTGGGPVTVTVNGVDDANPVWHVLGPATNPTLTNSTTGEALVWNGTVPSGQELIIDMGAQTATMEGANVFEFVSGSWVTLAPGTNRISYTAANTTTPSTVYWNEVVG